jgi:hypothetical protein
MPATAAIQVTLVSVPVALFLRSADYHEELIRECSLLLVQEPSPDVDANILRLAAELREQHEPLISSDAQVEAARTHGDDVVDLTFTLPSSERHSIERLGELLDEAERYCIDGKLLTMAPLPEISAFRRWFVQQLTSQLAGSLPVPWSTA